MEYLFIGGHQDGKRHQVEGTTVRVPIIRNSSVACVLPFTNTPQELSYEVEEYQKHRLAGSASTFAVFVLAGMSGDAVIEALLTNYSRHSIDELKFVS